MKVKLILSVFSNKINTKFQEFSIHSNEKVLIIIEFKLCLSFISRKLKE
jgi:hypothetical protein